MKKLRVFKFPIQSFALGKGKANLAWDSASIREVNLQVTPRFPTPFSRLRVISTVLCDMSSRGRGRGRGHRTPTKDPPSRTPTGRGMRRSTSGDRSPGTKDPMVLKHTEATQTASCKDQEGLKPPRRPGYGKEGSEIALRVNRFSVNVAIDTIHHYDVKFDPEPRKAKDNMKIMQTLTKEFSARLGGSKPAYDGKANLFTAKLLPFTNKEV